MDLPERWPDLTLPALEGVGRELRSLTVPALVCVGHAECGTTRLLLPYLDRVHRDRPGQVIAVLQDTPAEARALADELALSLPVLLDAEPWPLGAALGLSTVPLTLLVQPGGRIARGWPAFRRADVEAAAAAVGMARPVFRAGDDAPELRPG